MIGNSKHFAGALGRNSGGAAVWILACAMAAGCNASTTDKAAGAAVAAASTTGSQAKATAGSVATAVDSAAATAGSAVAAAGAIAGAVAGSVAEAALHDHAAHAGAAVVGGSAAMKGAPPDAKVFFVWPQHNSRVFSTFPVVFGAEGITVTPAGQDLGDPTKGHHHLIIDGETAPQGEVVPADDTHIHYGKGQTETELTLAPGKHVLRLNFADGAHGSYGPQLTSSINVEVVALPNPPPKVFFKAPAEAAKVKSPVKVVFGLEGMGIKPAGEIVGDKTTGHHHVIIDGDPVAAGKMVPMDARHIHFGGGQTEAELTLPAGKHTLTLQFADGAHISYGPGMSSTVNIEVE